MKVPFLLTVLAMVASLMTDFLTTGKLDRGTWILVGISAIVTLKLALTNRMASGHGVDGKLKLAGMPVRMALIYGILVFIIVGLVLRAPASIYALKLIALSLLYGCVAGLLDWYLSASAQTYYYDEPQLRSEMLARGFGKEKVDEQIERFRQRGFIPPRDNK